MIRLRLLITAFMLFAAGTAAQATTLEELLRAGELQAQIILDSESPYYQRAPIVIAVEVATPRWFSRGTRVQEFRIPNGIVRPVSSFADNQTRRINGQSWSAQRWRFRIYPLDSGDLVLPPISVNIAVNTEAHGSVEGELELRGPSLTVETPPGLGDITDWVASSEYSINEQWTGLAESYEPGDAITRERSFIIKDSPAMLIPEAPAPEVSGASVYTAPAALNDRQDRGSLRGERQEQLVITFENSGIYEIPGATYHWFNTRSQRMEEIIFEPRQFTVAGLGASAETSDAPGGHTMPVPTWVPPALLASALVLWLFRDLLRNAFQTLGEQWHERRRMAQAHRSYRCALRQQDYALALSLLHQRVCETGDGRSLMSAFASDQAALGTVRTLLEKAYGGSTGADIAEHEETNSRNSADASASDGESRGGGDISSSSEKASASNGQQKRAALSLWNLAAKNRPSPAAFELTLNPTHHGA
ncbi:MAG: hypothetical protein AAGG55_07595 [Pseudomonadota bacterium]